MSINVHVNEYNDALAGPYARAGNPILQSPTLQKLGFRIVVVDMVAAWTQHEWQNCAFYVAIALVYIFMRRSYNPMVDIEVFYRARVWLLGVLLWSWVLEVVHRVGFGGRWGRWYA